MTPTLLAAVLWAATPALAQDVDDLPEADAPAPDTDLPEADAPDADEDAVDEALDEPTGEESFDMDEDEGGELFEEDEVAPTGPGQDTAEDYRKQQNALIEADPEERLQAWEAYLQKYPNSGFLEQISKAIAEAEQEMYSGGITKETEGITDKRMIRFPEMALGENLNPATRLRAGFEFGLPSFINLIGDMEYAFSSQFSSHVAMRRRISGWSLELGPRLAVVKMEEPGLIVTITGDVAVGVDPAIVGIKPGLLAGIQPIDDLFIQAQGSQEWELYEGAWTPRYRGGANITFRAAQPVALWAEGTLESKYLQWPGGAHQFHQVAFGMRFYPAKNSKREDMADVMMGASVPAFYNYWGDVHKGSAMVSGHAYLE